jgi:hypothetical protein
MGSWIPIRSDRITLALIRSPHEYTNFSKIEPAGIRSGHSVMPESIDVVQTMKKNNEVLVRGQVPGEIIVKCTC